MLTRARVSRKGVAGCAKVWSLLCISGYSYYFIVYYVKGKLLLIYRFGRFEVQCFGMLGM